MPAKFRKGRTVFSTIAGAIGFGGMHALGYQPGVETTAGVDGSFVRDAVTAGLSVGSFFLPQLAPVANIIRSLTNHKDVEAVAKTTTEQLDREQKQNARITELERRVGDLEALT